MKPFPILLAAFLVGCVPIVLRAEESAAEIQCHKTSDFFAPPDSADSRKYAADRSIGVEHLAIDVTPDFKNRTIVGKTTIKFKPVAKPLSELSLDAVDLRVASVTSSAAILNYQVTGEKITITFAEPVAVDKEAWVAAEYHAEPVKGLYFRVPEMGYKPGDSHLFTQGEMIDARHWYPCPDAPNQKFTSEVTCHVPEGMTVISNGRLVSESKDPSTGLVSFHWSQEKPHANYLISLVAGNFRKIEDRHRDIPLAFYTPPSDINQATNSFRETRDAMGFFEEEIGLPYPWPKYDQVVVNDFVSGGMENTSATTLTDRTLFTDATENIRDSRLLVSHELAHQWFGDYVTCKDWSQVWLNEGFATYYEQLYDGHKNGRDAMLYNLYGTAQTILNNTNSRPIVMRTYDRPNEMFGVLAYQKGGWVLHMLRAQLGAGLYRRCIRTYLERHAFGSVDTEDLNKVIEELSGQSFDQFFDQWVYHGGVPELEVAYQWDARTKLARISLQQTQRIGDGTLLFNFPISVRFKTKSATLDKPITLKQKSEDFYFALDEEPVAVRIDPEYTVLARVKFNPPPAMLDEQLKDASDVVGRLLAVEALGKKQDKESVAKLQQRLDADPFYGVRVEAAKALGRIHTDEALAALIACANQPDARVRKQVFTEIGGFYQDRAQAAQSKCLEREKNPDIQAAALIGLGAYPNPEVHEILLRFLDSTSYRNVLADAAIQGMRTAHDPSYLDPLLRNLRARESDYTSRGFANALEAVAVLARDREADLGGASQFLLGYVNHPRQTIRVGALQALGTLEDMRAMPVLTKFATGLKDSPEQVAATNALQRIDAGRRSVEGLAALRQQVLDLQKANGVLRQDLEILEKKLDALTPQKPSPSKSPAPARPRRDKPSP